VELRIPVRELRAPVRIVITVVHNDERYAEPKPVTKKEVQREITVPIPENFLKIVEALDIGTTGLEIQVNGRIYYTRSTLLGGGT